MGSSSSTGRRNDQVLPPRPFPPPITTSYPLILLLSPPPPPPPSPPPIPVTPTTRPPPSPPPTPVSPATRPPPPPPPTLVSLPARPPPPPPPTPVSPATSPRQPPPPTHVSPATRPPPPPPPTPVSPATSPRPPPPPTHVSPATRPPPPPPPTPVSLAARPRPPPPPTPLPPATRPPPPPPPSSSHNANYPAPSLPPPPLPSFVFVANTPYFPSYAPNYPHYFHYLCFSDGGYSLPYAVSGQSSHLYYMNPRGGCPYPQPVPFYPGPPLRPTPRHVDHNEATTIRNDVNLRKDTIRMEVDEQNPDHHLVTFTFDSTVDGSFTVFYMAKEGEECSFSPQDPEFYKPVKVSFEKGLGQKFCQPSGTGIDLGFFALDDLNKPSPDEVYPLVISAEACSVASGTKPHAQITLAVIEKKESEQFQVKVIKQIVWIDGIRYELQKIYGIGSPSTSEFDDGTGKECVICMSERRNTAVMPCGHMCMCRECAEILSHQSNRCPICRKPVEQLMKIKV